MDGSQVTVHVLMSKETEKDSFYKHLACLQESGNKIEFFSDPDECVQSLVSNQNEKVLLVLSPGRCYLVDILSSLSCILYIYLTEAHDFEDTSCVRGIYIKPEELLIKLKKDIKMIEDNDLNFSVSSSLEANMSGTTTKDIQDDRMVFGWTRAILYSILNAHKPTENIYGDMLKECRDIYHDNQKMCEIIDDFEKTYDPKKAIWWYTKDSFLYRQINAAFRTENIPTIWKFRFVIQDIYKRLELLHEEQMKNYDSTSKKIHRVYRGQRMTLNELKQIKDNVDHLIAMNSFISTSLDYDFTKIWCGNGEDRPKFESVIFEIIIDQSKLENVPIIFANIAFESNYEIEQEVLLAMGTVFRIESVKLEGNIWKICLHACPFDDVLYGNLEKFTKFLSDIPLHDDAVQTNIVAALLEMGSFEKAEQMYQQMSSTEDPYFNTTKDLLKKRIDMFRMVCTNSSLKMSEFIEGVRKIHESNQKMKPFLKYFDHNTSILFETQLKLIDIFMQIPSSSNWSDPDSYRTIIPVLCQIIRQRQLIYSNNEMVLNNSSIEDSIELTDDTSQDSKIIDLMNDANIQSSIVGNFAKNDPRRILLLRSMASCATKKNEFDRGIGYLRNALLIPTNDNTRVCLYRELAEVYEKQKNWVAALECYENIISMLRLSETSPKLALTHMRAARIYQQMNDDHNELIHRKRGVQLFCQFQTPYDPIVSSQKDMIGLIFIKLGDMDAALKTFQDVIELGHSDSVKSAYQHISMICSLRGDYDMEYYNLIKSLEIAQCEIPLDIDFIIGIHLDLAFVESKRKHYDEEYIHVNEAIVMSANHKCSEETQDQIQSVLKMLSDLQCLESPYGRK